MVVVTLLSDYGVQDDFVGVCHGVIAQIAPQARVIDITHGIAAHDVRGGALVLRRALGYMPAGIHVAIVDPGVGSGRRGVALRCAGPGAGASANTGPGGPRVLIGPDNGLLMLAARRLGGISEAVDLANSALGLRSRSVTFHGRDLFAPVAAHLAAGATLAQAGDPLDPAELVELDLPRAQVTDGGLLARVLHADRFGNVLLDADPSAEVAGRLALGDAIVVNGVPAARARTFAGVPPGGLLVYEDADGALSLAINRGSACDALGLRIDDRVQIDVLA